MKPGQTKKGVGGSGLGKGNYFWAVGKGESFIPIWFFSVLIQETMLFIIICGWVIELCDAVVVFDIAPVGCATF